MGHDFLDQTIFCFQGVRSPFRDLAKLSCEVSLYSCARIRKAIVVVVVVVVVVLLVVLVVICSNGSDLSYISWRIPIVLNTAPLSGARLMPGSWCGNQAFSVRIRCFGGLVMLNTVLVLGLVGCTAMVQAESSPDIFV